MEMEKGNVKKVKKRREEREGEQKEMARETEAITGV
jgi:hypothetical protein